MFEQVTDHATRALGRMLTQFRSSAEFKGILNTLSAEIQTLEDAIFALKVVRDIDNATGVTLDQIGKLVHAVDRSYASGGTDANFRILIKAQIAVNKSQGKASDYNLIASYFPTIHGFFFKLRHGAPSTWARGNDGISDGETEHYSAVEMVCVHDDDPDNDVRMGALVTANDARMLARLLRAAAPAGSRVILRYRPESCSYDTKAFRFSGGTASDTAGFGVGLLFNSLDK